MTGGRSRCRSADTSVDRPNDSQTGLMLGSEPRFAEPEIGTSTDTSVNNTPPIDIRKPHH